MVNLVVTNPEAIESRHINLGDWKVCVRSRQSQNWLLLGGAGFIGAHILREFEFNGLATFVYDNFSRGKQERLPIGTHYITADVRDEKELLEACKKFQITGIVHLAALMQARESVRSPSSYWLNNVGATLAVASVLKSTSVRHVIFSSSCSVYGSIQQASITSPLRPESPYAMTKVASEQILREECSKLNVRLSILRYFNVIGNGDFPFSFDDNTETLLPSTARKLMSNLQPEIFGNMFSTPDGTAVRDYLDVRDLARAHRLIAVSSTSNPVEVVNVSSGDPKSVKFVIEKLTEVSGHNLVALIREQKLGDPAEVWSEPSEYLVRLGWVAQYDINQSVKDFWKSFIFHQRSA